MKDRNISIDFSNIKCIAYDFDGVMTDNRVLVTEDGKEAVFVNRGDGLAVAKIREMGIMQVIISTERNPVVSARADKLGLEVIQGIDDKGSVLRLYCERMNIALANVMYIGNDLNDISAFNIAGLTGAPQDAEREIYDMVKWKSSRCGGYGVIRDLYSCLSGMVEGD